MKHVIRKQLISLQLAAGHDAFSIQQSAKDYFYDQVAPALDKILTELSSPHEMISLDRVEIDLGNLHWKNEKLVANSDQLYQVLKQSLADRLAADKVKKNKANPVTISTLPAHACGQWLYYMETGVLPWALQHTPATWLEQVLHQLAINHRLTAKTKALMRQHRWFVLRVVRDHTEHFLQQLAGVITATPQPGLPAAIESKARQMAVSPSEYQQYKQQLWSAALLQFAAGKTSWQPEEAAPHVPPMAAKTVLTEEQPSPLHEGIFCAFAGVVLLHPFFKHLFSHLSLLENGLFKNEAAKAKAVLLIYYAATGHTEAKDHELVVAKTLCGMPVEEVLEAGVYELTEPEKQEAGNMLQAAIDQWTIIKNTSAEGLREGFLSRPGKLTREQTTITFTLEASGIDVLLDHLPWNLSIIKFPWLNQLIHVEWR